jgi:uncharacterized protein with HEPN domain
LKDRPYDLYVEDILESIDKIENYISGLEYEEFSKNTMVIDAVLRNLEIIGEASKHIPDDVRENNSKIPWKRMIGLRNIVIHGYFGVDTEIIWRIITLNLQEVKPFIERMRE